MVLHEGRLHRARYHVVGSQVRGVFNLGGDLSLAELLIRARDRKGLTRYARRCIDCMHGRMRHHGLAALTTISLVQGDALGRGFEEEKDLKVMKRSVAAQQRRTAIL